MTLRIERHTSKGRTTIRLMGRIGSEHLQELKEQLVGAALGSLDLDDVNVDVVRLLGECEAGGSEDSALLTLHLGVDPSRNRSRETIALDSRYRRDGRVQHW
jgi:hypothetical protein